MNPSPSTDTAITQKFDAKSLDKKAANKTALQKELNWPQEPKRPVVCLPLGMSHEVGGELFKETLPGLLSLPIELLVLGKGSNEYGAIFTQLLKQQSHRLHIVPQDETEISKMYAASDMALFFADPAATQELDNCLRYGVVPVAPETKRLENYNPVQEKGTAFLYDEKTCWNAFAALVRALETYKFPFDWRTIQKQCMQTAEI